MEGKELALAIKSVISSELRGTHWDEKLCEEILKEDDKGPLSSRVSASSSLSFFLSSFNFFFS